MSTPTRHPLSTLFGGELKARLLDTLTRFPDEAFHLRGLAAAARVESGNALKTLRALHSTGLVKVSSDGRGMRYQLDARSPLAQPLRQLFLVASGLMAELKLVAESLPVSQVLVFGSTAQGTARAESDVDVLVIGDMSSIEAQAAFKPVARQHGRPVNVMVIEAQALTEQLAAGSEFWRAILRGPIIMLKGEDIHAAFGESAVGQ